MLLKFREWLLETVTLPQAMQVYGYQAGDAVVEDDLKKRYRKLAMAHHPDRNPGDKEAEDMFKQASEGYPLLARFIGARLPAAQRPMGQHWQNWRPMQANPAADIKEELERAISAIRRGQPEDAFAAVSRLVDPNTGKLNNYGKPILKTSLTQWLDYYKQGFHDYLIPILNNALQLV